MRALFEDVANNYGAAAFTGVVVNEIVLPQDAGRHDCWLEFFKKDAATLTVYVYGSRTDAVTYSDDRYIASKDITIGASVQNIVPEANVEYQGLPQNIHIIGVFSAVPGGAAAARRYYWGYTASPDLVVCDNIVTILRTRVGAGYSLELLDSADIYVGDDTTARSLPAINVLSKPGEMILSDNLGSCMSMQIPIEVHIAVASLSEPSGAWRTCRELQAAVETILHDEERDSYGETRLWRTGAQGPGPAPGQSTVMLSVVSFMAEFPFVWRDDQATRG